MKILPSFVALLLTGLCLMCTPSLSAAEAAKTEACDTLTHDIIAITPGNVQEVLSTHHLLVLDVYADWCGPCKLFAPTFKEVSDELGDKYQFAKLDGGSYRSTTEPFKVTSLPTVLFLVDGKEVARKTGRLTKSQFVSAIQEAFEKK